MILSPSHPLWNWLFKSSAQAAVLVLLVLAAQWLFRQKLTPRWRYALWWLVVIRLMVPGSPESAVSVFNWIRWQVVQPHPAAAAAEVDGASWTTDTPIPPARVIRFNPNWPMNAIPTDPALQLDTQKATTSRASAPVAEGAKPLPGRFVVTWRHVVLWFWCIGAIALAGHVGWSVVRLRRQLRGATPLSDPGALEVLELCRGQMRTRRRLTLLETSAVNSPALCGLWRPRLLLPPGLIGRFTAQELRFVFLHELAHLKRHDIAVNWLTTLLQVVHWFNPLIWLAFHRMRADRELACDASVLACAQPDESRAYGETIIKLLEGFVRPSPLPGLVGILEDKNQMKRRMRSIVNFKGAPRVSLAAVLLLGVLAVVGLTDARSERRPTLLTRTAQNRRSSADAAHTSFLTTWVNDAPSKLQMPDAPVAPSSPEPATPRETKGRTVQGGTTLRGRVIDENGEPVVQAFTGLDGRRSVVTDALGRFVIEDAPPTGQYWFAHWGFFTITKTLLTAGDTEYVITLRRTIRVRGQVLDAESHEPIKAFSVVPGVVPGSRPETRWLWTESQSATEGAFDFKLPGSNFLSAPACRLMVEADGYTPALTKELTFENGEQTVEMLLRKGEPIKGVVLQPDGSPAKWANVFLWLGEMNLQDIPYRHYFQTDATGKFSFKPALVQTILVKHDKGFAALTPEQLRASAQVRLRPGGKVSGTVRLGGKPAAYCRVDLRPLHYKYEPWLPSQFSSARDETDSQGRFRLAGAPEGEYWLAVQHSRKQEFGRGYFMSVEFGYGLPISVRWGSTANVDLGGAGRPVVGKATVADGQSSIHWLNCYGALMLKLPEVPGLPDITRYDYPSSSEGPASEAARAFWLSPEGRARQRAARTYLAVFEEDGSFRIDDVPAGTYRLQLSIFAPERSAPVGRGALDTAGQAYSLEREVVVKSLAEDRSDEPLDLGVLELKATSPLTR
jgi:beta-lactamase regulating signal transducer with metallopeptidase domain